MSLESPVRAGQPDGERVSRAVRPPARERRTLAALAVFLTPTLVLLATGTQLSWLDNTIDPFIYVGATERLGDFLSRWPSTYFPYRFGYLLPAQLFGGIFGDIGGYVVLRAAIFGVIGLMAWPRRSERGKVRIAPAVLGAAVYALSPVVQRATFTTYTPTGSAFFVLSIALVAPIGPRGAIGPRWYALSGAVAALAWNSHPTVLPVCLLGIGLLLVDDLVEGRARNIWSCVLRGISWIAGTAATVAAAWLYLGLRYGAWDLYGSTLSQASRDTESVFLEQTATWFTWRHYLVLGPLALLTAAVAYNDARDPGVRRSLRRLGLVTAAGFLMFAAFQWLLDTPLLSIYYYSCIPLSLAMFLVARSIASIASSRTSRLASLYAVAALLLMIAGLLLGREAKASFTVIAAGVLVLTVGVGWLWLRTVQSDAPLHSRSVVGLSLALLLCSGYVSTSSPHDFPGSNPGFRVDPIYDTSMFTYDQSTLDVYRLAHDYAEFVPDAGEEPGAFRVWFRRFDSGYTNQVQATLVHGMSALQPFPQGGLPDLTPFELARIEEENLRYIIVVDSDPTVVRAGVDALADAGVPFDEKRTKTFREGDFQVTATVLERRMAP